MKNKILSIRHGYQIIYTTLAIAAVIVIYLAILLLGPFKEDTFLVKVKSPAHPGSVLQYNATVCGYSQVPISLTIRLSGWPQNLSTPSAILLSLPSLSNFSGCHYVSNQGYLRVPTSWPPGNYKLQIAIVYKVNHLRSLQQIIYTNTFKVV